VRLSEAAGNRLDHAEFLELILQDELAVRGSRQIEELATCRFIREKGDLLLLGPPGVGKSFLAQAIGHQAIKAGMLVLYRSIFDLARDFLGDDETPKQQDKMLARYLKPELLIVDDMGMKQLPRRSGEYLLEIIMRRHENRSTMMTSNRPLDDWAKLIGDVPAPTAILDRFLQHTTIIQITGKSYRLRNAARSDGKNDAKDEAAAKPKHSSKKEAEERSVAGGEGVVSPPENASEDV
jgi:DNA replication protein DnaC